MHDTKEPKSGGAAWKTLVLAVLAILCGFLTFNFHYIISTSHVHISLAHHHKTTAFCAFIGCKLDPEGKSIAESAVPVAAVENLGAQAPAAAEQPSAQAPAAAEQPSAEALAAAAAKQKEDELAAAAAKQKAEELAAAAAKKKVEDLAAAAKQKEEELAAAAKQKEQDEKLAKTRTAMMTRVCGSPAVDGYSHVVPKCLEDSPTAKWWVDYYAAGGNQGDLVVHIEKSSDYDGLAVFWGINNKKKTVEECAEHCLKHMPNTVGGPYEKLPCNAFAYCPDEVCFEPDAHHHTKGDCWLKFTEGPANPEVNMRGDLPPDYRARHPTAPNRTQWESGVLLPPGVALTNGTWSPRWKW